MCALGEAESVVAFHTLSWCLAWHAATEKYYCWVCLYYLGQSLQCNRLTFSVIMHIFLMFTQWFNMQHTIRHHVVNVHLSAWQHLGNPQCTPPSTKAKDPGVLCWNIKNASVATLTNFNFHQQQWSQRHYSGWAQNLSWKWLFTASNCNGSANFRFSPLNHQFFSRSCLQKCKYCSKSTQ